MSVINASRDLHHKTRQPRKLSNIIRTNDHTQPRPPFAALPLKLKPVSMKANDTITKPERMAGTVSPSVVLTLPFDPKMNSRSYYLLLLSGQLSKMYLGDNHRLQLIKNNVPRDLEQCSPEEHKAGDPCTKPCARKQGLIDKFLYHMDEALGAILVGHPLPVFVLAPAPVAEHFARITRNDQYISVYIHEHCLETTEEELLQHLQPYLDDWSEIRQQWLSKI
jgi:hypothetical protein